MPAETVNLDYVRSHGENLFEVIVAVAQRAKVINGRIRKKKDIEKAERELEYFDPEVEQPVPNYVPEVKATTLAMGELMKEGIKFKYPEPSENRGFGESLH